MKTAFMLTRTLFASLYKIVRGPGKVILVAGNSNRIYDENLKKYKHIVNLRAIAATNEQKVKDLYIGKQEIPVEALNGLTMTANIIENDNGRPVSIPIPGEKVEAIVEWVDGREGKVLAVQKMSFAKAVEAEAFKFDDEVSQEEKESQSLDATKGEGKETVKASTLQENF